MNNLIQLSNINKSFNTSKKVGVLKKISYKFKKGKIYSLMGPSGSGKSTLLNLISLIDRPSSGSISIGNKLINFNKSKHNDILRANKIGIIYQQDNLLTDFTALENIYLASLAAGNEKKKSIIEDINHLIFHPGGKKIVNTVESLFKSFGKNIDDTKEVLKLYGNMSSATVLYVLERFMDGDRQQGEKGLMLSFGPGFSAQRILLEW